MPKVNPEQDPGGWAPYDLGALMRNPPPLPETTGRLGIVYPGTRALLFGPPESGKSTLAMAEAAWHLENSQLRLDGTSGGPVLYFDEEAGPVDVVGRLQALGATAEQVDQLYFPPDGRDPLADFGLLARLMDRHRPALVVFDSLSVFLGNAGLEENSNKEVTRWLSRVAAPLTQRYGAAVLIVDHVSKATTGDGGRYARGAGAKLAQVEVAWRVDAVQPFSRSQSGRLRLRCTKDKPGGITSGTEVHVAVTVHTGRIVVTPTKVSPDEAKALAARFAADGGNQPRGVGEVVAVLSADWQTIRQLAEAAGRPRTTVSKALNMLLDQGRVEWKTDPESSNGGRLWRALVTADEEADPW